MWNLCVTPLVGVVIGVSFGMALERPGYQSEPVSRPRGTHAPNPAATEAHVTLLLSPHLAPEPRCRLDNAGRNSVGVCETRSRDGPPSLETWKQTPSLRDKPCLSGVTSIGVRTDLFRVKKGERCAQISPWTTRSQSPVPVRKPRSRALRSKSGRGWQCDDWGRFLLISTLHLTPYQLPIESPPNISLLPILSFAPHFSQCLELTTKAMRRPVSMVRYSRLDFVLAKFLHGRWSSQKFPGSDCLALWAPLCSLFKKCREQR